MEKIKAVFNWSGGKDSAHALWKVMQTGNYDIVALLTTINSRSRLSTMHNIPVPLLERQAEMTGIPLYTVDLSPQGNMEDYNAAMEKAILHFKQRGVTHFIFGDIYLHDVRKYREDQLRPHGIETVEPLWGKTSAEVMEDFLETGIRTVIVTTMAEHLGEEYIGRPVDRHFIRNLSADIDPNGENGEYHTFCYDGPLFRQAVPFRLGRPSRKDFDIKMEDGSLRTFSYWFGELHEA